MSTMSMSASGGKADIRGSPHQCPLMTQSGHCLHPKMWPPIDLNDHKQRGLTGLRTAFAVEEKAPAGRPGLGQVQMRTRSERVHLIAGWWDIGRSMRQLRLRHCQRIEAFAQ